MSNTLIFLRHGKTQVDSNASISEWKLSEVGLQQAEEVARTKELQNVDIIVISGEEKAFQTAQPLIERLKATGKEVWIIRASEISELNRDKGGFMDIHTYEEAVKMALSNPEISVHDWEPTGHALERFSKKVEHINGEFKEKKILFVGHAYTMNMYFAKLLGELDKVYERLEKNDFCDWGVVKEGKVIKDLGPDLGRVGERMV